MKHIFILLSLFLSLPIFSQNIGKLSYQQLIQAYRGDTVYTKLNSDSVNYYTDLGSFRFNKDIYVKGVKLGSGGGGSEIAKYLKNYSPTDTVISITNAPAYTTAISVKTSLANQCIRLQNNMSYGYGLLSYVTGNEGIAGYFEASGSPANTAYGLKVNTKYAYGLMIDSLNTHKYSINSSGIPRIYNFTGTGNRSLIAKPDGTIAVGSASSVIATQLKNYNINQDTVIRLPDLTSGKFGIYQLSNNGISFRVDLNKASGFVNYIHINDGNVSFVGTNNTNGWSCNLNNGDLWSLINNSNTGTFLRLDNNNGVGLKFISSKNTAIGIKSYAADSVSNTSGALTGTFGKTASHLDIDGFGHYRNIQTTAPTITLGSGAGTGATYTLIAGSTDKAGVISVTTGTSPTSSGDIFTITYAYPFKGIAVFMAVPANDAASSVQGQARPHMNGYSPTFSGLTASGSALTAGTTYVWHYFVAQ